MLRAMNPQRVVRLSIGLSPAMKAVSVALGLVFAAMGGFFSLFVWLGVGVFEGRTSAVP
jgi:hypothetical protein